MQTLRLRGAPILDLTVSNPTAVLPHYPHAAIAGAYSEIESFQYHPDASGSVEARRAITAYYGELGIAISPDQVLLTASTSEAYALLFKLLCDSGDEVLIPVPSYPLFEYLAALESVRTVPYHLRFDGSWFLDVSELERQRSNRTRAVVVVSPHNPTGSYLKADEAAHLLNWAQSHGLAVIADEVFLNYRLSSAIEIVPSLAVHQQALSFCLNGLSKSAGMPQMKLGWIVINGTPEERTSAKARLELLLDTYLSVSTPVQAALPQLLQIGTAIRSQLQAVIESNLLHAQEAFAQSAATPLHVEGGWSLIVKLPALFSEEQWTLALLEEEHLLVQPGYFFDMPAEPFIVLSLITPADTFQAGIERIANHVDRACKVTRA